MQKKTRKKCHSELPEWIKERNATATFLLCFHFREYILTSSDDDCLCSLLVKHHSCWENCKFWFIFAHLYSTCAITFSSISCDMALWNEKTAHTHIHSAWSQYLRIQMSYHRLLVMGLFQFQFHFAICMCVCDYRQQAPCRKQILLHLHIS